MRYIIILKDFVYLLIYLLLERGERREKERERNINVGEIRVLAASHLPPTGNLACSPGVCPDWELNQQPFGSQAGIQSPEPYQPGLRYIIEQIIDSESSFVLFHSFKWTDYSLLFPFYIKDYFEMVLTFNSYNYVITTFSNSIVLSHL